MGAWLSKELGEYLEKRRSLILRERWRSDLLVQLGSCIYGDIWDGQVEEIESGPLCNSMSTELRSLWKNIANSILQEVCPLVYKFKFPFVIHNVLSDLASNAHHQKTEENN